MKLKANYFKIKNHKFYSYEKTLIIAEIGSNHNNKFENNKHSLFIPYSSTYHLYLSIESIHKLI